MQQINQQYIDGEHFFSGSQSHGDHCSTCGYIPCTCSIDSSNEEQRPTITYGTTTNWIHVFEQQYPNPSNRISIARAYASYLKSEQSAQSRPRLKRRRAVVGAADFKTIDQSIPADSPTPPRQIMTE